MTFRHWMAVNAHRWSGCPLHKFGRHTVGLAPMANKPLPSPRQEPLQTLGFLAYRMAFEFLQWKTKWLQKCLQEHVFCKGSKSGKWCLPSQRVCKDPWSLWWASSATPSCKLLGGWYLNIHWAVGISSWVYTPQMPTASTMVLARSCVPYLTYWWVQPGIPKPELANDRLDKCFLIHVKCHRTWWYVRRDLTQYQCLNLVSLSSRMNRLHCEVNRSLGQQMHGASSNTTHLEVLTSMR